MKKKSKRKETKKLAPQAKEGQTKEPDSTTENAFDFGGLPDRDLKKSLGCG